MQNSCINNFPKYFQNICGNISRSGTCAGKGKSQWLLVGCPGLLPDNIDDDEDEDDDNDNKECIDDKDR